MIDLEELIAQAVAAELDRRGITAAPANDAEAITVAAYAQRYSISESTVRKALADGRLEHEHVGRSVRIPADAKIQPRARDAGSRADLILLRGKVG